MAYMRYGAPNSPKWSYSHITILRQIEYGSCSKYIMAVSKKILCLLQDGYTLGPEEGNCHILGASRDMALIQYGSDISVHVCIFIEAIYRWVGSSHTPPIRLL